MNPEVKEIVRTAAFEALQKVIRDAFLEGRDTDAIRILESDEYRTLKSAGDVGKRTIVAMNSYMVIAAGATANIVARPQICPFKATRVIVSPYCAPHFVIGDLRVGNRSQLPCGGELAADMFAVAPPLEWLDQASEGERFLSINITAQGELALGLPMDFEPCQISQDLVMWVTNISGQAMSFRGAFLGQVLTDHRQATFDF